MASTSTVRPMATLKTLANVLMDAIAACLNDASAKQVRVVRTTSRRIEAQLKLLNLLPNVPDHRKPAKRLRKQLRALRRATGQVRDLDVWSRTLGVGREEMPELWQQGENVQVQQEGRKLEEQLTKRREILVKRLLLLLKKREGEVARDLEDLIKALSAGGDLSLSETRLVERMLAWFEAQVPNPATARSEEEMHEVRKTAKLVRYVLESAPAPARKAQKLAETFHALQQRGGHWHDLLTLTKQTRRRKGKKSALKTHINWLLQESLTQYRAALTQLYGQVKANL